MEAVRIWLARTALLWRMPLVATILLTAGLFALHAQHDAPVPMILLVTQHRMISATLVVIALAVLLSPPEVTEHNPRPTAIPLLMLVLAAQFVLYTEGGSVFGEALPGAVAHSGHTMP